MYEENEHAAISTELIVVFSCPVCSFVTYRSARHLDTKHTVFGRLVFSLLITNFF